MRVISLGWGTQSFALAAMSALGVLPPVDVVIHADTTHERYETYIFAKRWTPWLEEHGVKVVTVADTDAAIQAYDGKMIPAHTSTYVPKKMVDDTEWVNYEDGEDEYKVKTGKKVEVGGYWKNGMARRTCTQRWKIAPIRRWLQKHRHGEQVEMWMGITLDEAKRIKMSNVGYITNHYPFLETGYWNGKMMRRADVIQWLKDNELGVPERSACYFCPYHSKSEWRSIKDSDNWDKAVDFDEMVRDARDEPVKLYLNNTRVPLEELNLDTPEEMGQLSLWDEECEGMCGI